MCGGRGWFKHFGCMCECADHTNEVHNWFGEKRFRLADFFDQWWDPYCESPKHFIHPEQYKAVRDIRTCRTAALGVDVYTCPSCGEETKVYHSCKNRFCPTCNWSDTVKWAEKIRGNMLNIPHRHVTFTIPHELNWLIKRNQFLLLNMQMQASAETLSKWMEETHQIRPGIISVLHTAGEKKEYHTHVHMILSWGGITRNGSLEALKGKFIDYDTIKDRFRENYKGRLLRFFREGQLDHNFIDELDLKKFLSRISEKHWIVYFNDPIDTPVEVIRYIGRYTKRACLSEYKITRMEGEIIAFKYKDNKHKDYYGHPIEKELELNYRDFFPLLLQHVPLPRFRLVRYYGIYSNRGHIPREYFSKIEVSEMSWRSLQQSETGQDPLLCPQCKVSKVYTYSYAEKNEISYKYFRLGLRGDPHATFFQKVA